MTGVSLKLFGSYLGGREQFVELDGKRSSARLVDLRGSARFCPATIAFYYVNQ